MAGGQLPVAPTWFAADPLVLALSILVGRIVADRATDVSGWDRSGRSGQPDRFHPGLEQVRRKARRDSAPLLLRQQGLRARDFRRGAPPVAVNAGQLFPRGVLAGWDTRVAIPRDIGIEGDQVRDPLRDAVRRAGDDHPP
ncbi:MAG: hypothetical protein H0V47_08445 [Chloroflexia bacterium]|nr:hypothetical protein [Chloroflexia bacterium]